MDQILKFIEFNQYNLPFILELFAVYILILWLAVVAWTLKDITTRSDNFLVILLSAILVAIGNVPGLVLYLLIRPSQTIEEDQNKELFYASVIDRKISACNVCGCLVRSDYKFCPNCSHELELQCPHCKRLVNPTWKFCTYCNEKLTPDTFSTNLALRFEQITVNARGILGKSFKNLWKGMLFVWYRIIRGFKLIFNGFDKLFSKIPAIKKLKFAKPDIKLQLPEINWFKKETQLKVAAEKRHIHERRSHAIPVAKKKRGRPKGTGDAKPRKKRADAGKKRGNYSKS